MRRKKILRVAICDDNKSVCKQLEEILNRVSWSIEEDFIIESFYSGSDLLRCIENDNNFDIIFLDILMDDMTGIDVGLTIRNVMQDEYTKLIYISSTEDFMRDLFNVRITQFIVKPLQKEAVEKTFKKAIDLLKKDLDMFKYKKGGRSYVVRIKEVHYFESVGKKIRIVTENGSDEFYGSLSSIIEKEYHNFLQTHRSYYVNFGYILSYSSKDIVLKSGAKISIGSEKKGEVVSKLMELTDSYLKGE